MIDRFCGLKISRTKLCPYKHGHGILTRCCQYTVDIHYGSVAMATHLPVNIFINSSRLGLWPTYNTLAYMIEMLHTKVIAPLYPDALATTFAVEWTLCSWAYNKFWECVYSVKALPYAVHRVCLVCWEVIVVIQLWLFTVIIGILSL